MENILTLLILSDFVRASLSCHSSLPRVVPHALTLEKSKLIVLLSTTIVFCAAVRGRTLMRRLHEGFDSQVGPKMCLGYSVKKFSMQPGVWELGVRTPSKTNHVKLWLWTCNYGTLHCNTHLARFYRNFKLLVNVASKIGFSFFFVFKKGKLFF